MNHPPEGGVVVPIWDAVVVWPTAADVINTRHEIKLIVRQNNATEKPNFITVPQDYEHILYQRSLHSGLWSSFGYRPIVVFIRSSCS